MKTGKEGKVLITKQFKDQTKSNRWKVSIPFWNRITWPFRHFYRRMKRLIEFTPVIWKGYDFDYSSATDLFSYQLERIAKHLESDYAMAVDAKQTAMRIRTGIKLMDKVFEEDYAMEYMDILEKKYGKMRFEFIETDDVPDDADADKLYRMEIAWGEKGQYSEEEIEQIELEHSRLFEEAQKKQEKAERILWKFIHHNLRGWWD